MQLAVVEVLVCEQAELWLLGLCQGFRMAMVGSMWQSRTLSMEFP